MYIGFKHLHSFLAYILLAAIVFSLIYAIIKFVKRSPFNEKVRKVTLIGFIASHLQLLIGIVLYAVSPWGFASLSGDVMQDSFARLLAIEHPLTMLIGIILISVGYIKAKKPGDDARRFKTIILFYTLGLVFILIRIPWQVWP